MGALGAAAGAFEGDNAREEQSLRRAQLSQQGAMFGANLQQRQAEQQSADARDTRNFTENQARDQRNFTEGVTRADQQRQDSLDVRGEQRRQFDLGENRAARQEDRTARLDGWSEALKDQELKQRELQYAQAEDQFGKYKQAQQLEDEQLANRKRVAQTGTASLLRLAYESPNGIVTASALGLFNKENGTAFQQAYLDKTTGVFSMDAKDDKGNVVPNRMDAGMQENALRMIYGDKVADSFFKRQADSQRIEASKEVAGIRSLGSANTEEEALKLRLDALDKSYKALKTADGDDTQESLIVKNAMTKIAKQIGGVTEDAGGGGLSDEQKRELSQLAKQASEKYPKDRAKAEAYWREMATAKGIQL